MTPERRRFLARAAFWCWAIVLFTGTHWPALTLPGTGRPDLFVHITIFGVWAALLLACGYFGRPTSARNILMVLLIAPVYAAFDEGLQAIPWVRRHAALDDWACNVVGISLACLGAFLIGVRNGRRAVSNQGGAVDTLGPPP